MDPMHPNELLPLHAAARRVGVDVRTLKAAAGMSVRPSRGRRSRRGSRASRTSRRFRSCAGTCRRSGSRPLGRGRGCYWPASLFLVVTRLGLGPRTQEITSLTMFHTVAGSLKATHTVPAFRDLDFRRRQLDQSSEPELNQSTAIPDCSALQVIESTREERFHGRSDCEPGALPAELAAQGETKRLYQQCTDPSRPSGAHAGRRSNASHRRGSRFLDAACAEPCAEAGRLHGRSGRAAGSRPPAYSCRSETSPIPHALP